MKKNTYFKTMLLAVMLLVGSGSAWGQIDNFYQNAAMATATNWSTSAMPTNTNDVGITSTTTTLTLAAKTLVGRSMNVTNTSSYSIGNSTTTATNSTITLGNTTSFTNLISTIDNDIFYLFNATTASNLTIKGPNTSTGAGTLSLILVSSGNFNIGSGSILTISALISGAYSINKTNSGMLVLSGANTYSGGTTITGGTLQLGAVGVLADAATIILNGGTLKTGATTGFSETVGILNLSNSSTIALGTGVHSLSFANSISVTWNGTTLTITGWTGEAGVSGTAGKIFVGTDATGLTTDQLAKISFSGYTTGAQILISGEVVPLVPPTTTYTWQGADSGDWTTATNWNPTRTTLASTDILQFTDGTTKTVTNVPTQTIGQLKVSGNTLITLQASGANTLTIAGGTGVDFSVEAGSQLNISGTNALIIALSSGSTGSISGSMDFTGAANQITAADASSLIFNAGAVFTQDTYNTGNVFGSGTSNSVIFANNSTFVQYAGSNPFQKTAPASVVVFQTGSLFKIKASVSPAFNGRNYANLEIDASGSTFTPTGSSPVTMDNLTVTNGTLNFNVTGTHGHAIKGNINVASGAILNFAPSDAGTVNLNGTTLQTISGTGTITTGANSTLVVDNVGGVVLDNNANLTGNLIIVSGALNVNPAKQLTVTGALTNNGTINLLSDADGTATILTPATISGSGTYNVQQYLTGSATTDRQWWYVSSPVTGAKAKSGIFTPSGVNNFGYYNETGDPPAYVQILGDEVLLEKGKGYVAQLKSTDTFVFSGTLNNGDVPVAVTRTGTTAGKRGFNLVGNPYPSYLDWTKVDTTNVLSTIWYRSFKSSTSEMIFDTYNGETAVGINNSNAGNLLSNLIPPMQAFWVKVRSEKADVNDLTVDFTNAMRFHRNSGTTGLLRAPQLQSQQILRLDVSNGANSDQAVVVFNENASNSFDDYDSPKMSNNNVNIAEIYTLAGTEEVAINGLNSLTSDKELTLGFRPGKTCDFTIEATEVSNFSSDTKVMLLDKLTGVEQELAVGSPYSFSSNATATNDRFSILFKTSSIATGLNNATNNQNVLVYRNLNNHITVICNAVFDDQSSISVYNAVGQKLSNQKLAKTSTEINGAFTAGVYLVTVHNGGQTVTKKVIIK